MATGRGGPVHAVGHARGKMMQAGLGMRLVPMSVQRTATSTRSRPAPRAAWVRAEFAPDPPYSPFEVELAKAARRRIAQRLGGKTEVRLAPPVTRIGIAVDFGLRQRRCYEDHARAVARRLGLA